MFNIKLTKEFINELGLQYHANALEKHYDQSVRVDFEHFIVMTEKQCTDRACHDFEFKLLINRYLYRGFAHMEICDDSLCIKEMGLILTGNGIPPQNKMPQWDAEKLENFMRSAYADATGKNRFAFTYSEMIEKEEKNKYKEDKNRYV